MAESHHVSVLDHFADLDDPRVERTRRHKLVDIIAIAICAIICGADSWVHVELFCPASTIFADSCCLIEKCYRKISTWGYPSPAPFSVFHRDPAALLRTRRRPAGRP